MLKIGEFSKITGVPIRTLRYYDEIDLFKPTEIDLFTGYRYYQEYQIEDLNIINKLKSVGFTLEEIKNNWNNFTNETMENKKKQIQKEIKDANKKIKELDKLRSTIHNGKFNNEIKETRKVKTIF